MKEKWSINTNYIGLVLATFAAVVSFFQINSWWADQHHFNGLFGWLGIGILCSIVSIYFLVKTIKSSY